MKKSSDKCLKEWDGPINCRLNKPGDFSSAILKVITFTEEQKEIEEGFLSILKIAEKRSLNLEVGSDLEITVKGSVWKDLIKPNTLTFLIRFWVRQIHPGGIYEDNAGDYHFNFEKDIPPPIEIPSKPRPQFKVVK